MSIEGRVTLFPLPVFARDEGLRRWAVAALVLSLFVAVATVSLAFPDDGKAGYGSRLGAGAAGGAAGQCVPFTLDIQGFPAGYILQGDEFAGQGVDISVSARNGFPDNLIVFDSDSDEGELDDDLRVGIGNILILADNLTDVDPADGLVDKPDENNFGGVVTFTFDQPLTIDSFIFVDHDHQAGDFAAAYDAAGNEITKVFIPISGDGSVQTVQIDADGVSRFVLDYRDSGGFVPPEIECPPPGTPTPPVETPTPPVETPTPPVETPTPPAVETGTATPPVQTPTPPIETGTATPPVETGTATPPVETGTATPPIETGTATPPVETGTATPPVETGTATPPVETGTATPPVETGTPTPAETPTPTPTGGESPTPTGTAVTGTQTPAPTVTTVVSTATATPSPEAVLGAVTGPTGPGGVPTTGSVADAGGSAAGKLLIVLGSLIGMTGVITALSTVRKRA
jgi:hypothetical protein